MKWNMETIEYFLNGGIYIKLARKPHPFTGCG